jgi:hypothetical protein
MFANVLASFLGKVLEKYQVAKHIIKKGWLTPPLEDSDGKTGNFSYPQDNEVFFDVKGPLKIKMPSNIP